LLHGAEPARAAALLRETLSQVAAQAA